MNGPEHYLAAQRLLTEAAVEGVEGTMFVRPENLAAAQVHATLALVAAKAMSAPVEDRDAWYAVAGTRPGTVKEAAR